MQTIKRYQIPSYGKTTLIFSFFISFSSCPLLQPCACVMCMCLCTLSVGHHPPNTPPAFRTQRWTIVTPWSSFVRKSIRCLDHHLARSGGGGCRLYRCPAHTDLPPAPPPPPPPNVGLIDGVAGGPPRFVP